MKKYRSIYEERENLKIILEKKQLTYKENAIFFTALSELTNAGIPIMKIFEIDIINIKNKKIIQIIKESIKNGNSLSSSLKQTKAFSYISISIVQTGEETGDLSQAFEKLANYYNKLNESKRAIQSSMFYPSILVISILFLMMFINYHFIPSIMNMYDYNMEKLNVLTKTIFKISEILNIYKMESIVLMISVTFFIYTLIFELYKMKDERKLIKIPIISKLMSSHLMSNILWSYSVMLSSGIDVIKSTMIIEEQIKNKFAKEKLQIFKDSIKSGNSILKSIEMLNLNDENLNYFISLGEQSGNLDKNIKILSDIYTNRFDKDIKRLGQIIQPALIIIITFIVGLLMIGVVIPILSYENIM